MPRSPLTETIKRAEGMVHHVQENLSAEEYMLFLDMVDPLPEPVQKPTKKKSSKKSAGGGGGKSKHASSLGQQIQKRPRQTTADESDDDNRFDGTGAQAAREDFISDTRCHFTRADGNPCKLLPDHNIHHLTTANEYHEFQSVVSSAAGSGG